ncbi:uncharacterized protein (TIGR03083 family) [Streptomyces sp. V4I23]|uniref:maleylpyruvate isomerase family mycothiol-dependent enzyme n=1 Tax=Streptomyces sp. V4I23 TaxID=3042282 RepID=UPI002782C500|nr:maleylpyruvate isomerase family mycothiol-dependent enzyme [Streptomyces sp. V4I23]MDQ1012238.1 uncharacterized protein (TIGR03083 family) [Streptomyces sp. V4I23]
MSDALLNTLAEALADVVISIDTCDDDVLDPDTAVKWLETTGSLLDRLPPADRRELARLFRRTARRYAEGARRDELLRIPDGFGLDDDQHELYCDAIEHIERRFVATVREADPAAPVTTCPGWTFADLVRHHGTTHRWMEHLVRTRACERVRSREIPLDLPDDPAAYPDWLARGADSVLGMLRKVDPDTPMWSNGADQRVAYFPRRLLFEALVHLADAELSLGRAPSIDPGTAADGIEEFLENLPYFSWLAEPVSRLANGSVVLTATDTGASWTAAFGEVGFRWSKSATSEPSVRVEGPAGDLLLLTYGRRSADDPHFRVTGDASVLASWLAATAF